MNNNELNQRITELEKKRSVALARQQWSFVIELEARMEECELWKKRNEVKEAQEMQRAKENVYGTKLPPEQVDV